MIEFNTYNPITQPNRLLYASFLFLGRHLGHSNNNKELISINIEFGFDDDKVILLTDRMLDDLFDCGQVVPVYDYCC